MNNLNNIFDNLSISEIDELLDSKIKFKIKSNERDKIYKKLLLKIGKKKTRSFYKRPISIAVSITVIFVLIISLNFDSASALFSNIFGFIPNYKIIENNGNENDIKYIIKNSAAYSENDNYKVSILNAFASDKYISITFQISKKSNDNIINKNSYCLYVNNRKYISKNNNYSVGNNTTIQAVFDMEADDLNVNNAYKLECSDLNLSIEFNLKEIKCYTTLEEIGPTVTNNNISITASAKSENGQLKIELYTLNNSEYDVVSISDDKVILKTNKGSKAYQSFNNESVPSFVFDVSDNSNDFVLNIPSVTVSGNEENCISLPIPADNEILNVNKDVIFKNSKMKILNVQKVIDGNGIYQLKINLDYYTENEKTQMVGASFSRTDNHNNPISSSYSGNKEDNVLKTIYYDIGNSDEKINLKITKPVYVLKEEYDIRLDRP